MSIFSEHFNAIVCKHNLTLPYLEEKSGFSLALISKIKTGKRLPDQEDKMILLIKALRCSVEEEKKLFKEYKIAKIGEEKYRCIEETRRAFENIAKYPSQVHFSNEMNYMFSTKSTIVGEDNINALFRYMANEELKLNKGIIKLMIRSDKSRIYDDLMEGYSNEKMRRLSIFSIFSMSGGGFSEHSIDNVMLAQTF